MRITSLFGTYFRPRKKRKESRHLTVSFVLVGTIPSKKNLAWAASNLYFLKNKLYAMGSVKQAVDFLCSDQGLKVYTQNSKKYVDWVELQTPVLQEQAKFWHEKFGKYGISFPLTDVSVKVYHYWRDEMERDLTNKMDTVNDILVSAGIVLNDSWQVIRQIHSEAGNYKDEVRETITRIDVTQYFYE